MSGTRTMFRAIGLLTATAIGAGLRLGDGHGMTMRLGDLRRFTMAVGSMAADGGAGARARFMRVLIMDLRLSASSEEAVLASGLEWAAARHIIPGITLADGTGTTSTSTTPIFTT